MGAEWWLREAPIEPDLDGASELSSPHPRGLGEVQGVIKARASTNNDVSLMWEGRIRNMLVSLGVVSDFSNRSKPIKAVGLELSYFSSV